MRARCSLRKLTPALHAHTCYSKKQHSKPKWIFSNIFSTGEKGKETLQTVKGKLFRGLNHHLMSAPQRELQLILQSSCPFKRKERFSSSPFFHNSTKMLVHNTSRVISKIVNMRKRELPWLQPLFSYTSHLQVRKYITVYSSFKAGIFRDH